MESSADLTGIAVVILAALLCGMAMARLRQPAIVGYILAGIILGPSALGVVDEREKISTLAELGVLLLLFLVGMELSVRAFLVTWRLALTVVALQVGISVLVILVAAFVVGFPIPLAVLLGFFVALSSTAVAIKMLEEIGQLRTRVGRVTVSILIAQDLAFLPMILVVDFMGAGEVGFWGVLKFVFSITLLILLISVLNQRRRVNLPFARIFVGHVDLSPLTGLVYCFGAGALFGVIGLSAPYGAFIAGLIIGNSAQRKLMHHAVQPVQSILVMVFFLSIGLLIDLKFIVNNFGTVVSLLLMVTLFKTALNVTILHLLGESWPRAFLNSVVISQIGEFSFLLAASGLAVGAIDENGARLAISVTVLSLALSPIWLVTARRVEGIAARQISTLRELLNLTYRRETVTLRRESSKVRRRLGLSWRRGGAAKKTDSESAPPDAEAAVEPPIAPEASKSDSADTTGDTKPGNQMESLGRLVRAVADSDKDADAAPSPDRPADEQTPEDEPPENQPDEDPPKRSASDA